MLENMTEQWRISACKTFKDMEKGKMFVWEIKSDRKL